MKKETSVSNLRFYLLDLKKGSLFSSSRFFSFILVSLKKGFNRLRFFVFLMFLVSLSACALKENRKDSEKSSGEKLSALRSKLIEKQSRIEDLKTENLVLKKMLSRNQGQKSVQRPYLKEGPVSIQEEKKEALYHRLHREPDQKFKVRSEDRKRGKENLNSAFPSEKKPRRVIRGHTALSQRMMKDFKGRARRNLGAETREEDLMFSDFFEGDRSSNDLNSSSSVQNSIRDKDSIRNQDMPSGTGKGKKKSLNDKKDKGNQGYELEDPYAGNKKDIKKTKRQLVIYKRARQAYKDLDLDKLKKLSLLSIKHFPEGSYTDDILFHLGKGYIKKGFYNQAIQTFDQLIAFYSKSDRKASALFWKGVAYQRLNLLKPANSTFQRLIEEYPKSPEAFFAKRKVKKSKESSFKEDKPS